MKYVRQLDSMQCGVACLSMICNHYGKNISVRTLSTICFASNEGVSLKGLSEAATKLGFNTYSCRVNINNYCCPIKIGSVIKSRLSHMSSRD